MCVEKVDYRGAITPKNYFKVKLLQPFCNYLISLAINFRINKFIK